MGLNLIVICSIYGIFAVLFIFLIIKSVRGHKPYYQDGDYVGSGSRKNRGGTFQDYSPLTLALLGIAGFSIFTALFVFTVVKRIDLDDRMTVRDKKVQSLRVAMEKQANKVSQESQEIQEESVEQILETEGLKEDNLLNFNIIKSVPPIFKRETLLTEKQFAKIIPGHKDVLCYYNTMAGKAFLMANREQIPIISNGRVLELTYLECMDQSVYVLYDIYSFVYKTYINPDASVPADILSKVTKAKDITIKAYFNIEEDFPTELPLSNITLNDFRELMQDDSNKTAYCKYYVHFQKAYETLPLRNKAIIAGIRSTTFSSCYDNFFADTEYSNYVTMVAYVLGQSSLKPDEKRLSNALLSYKLPLVIVELIDM